MSFIKNNTKQEKSSFIMIMSFIHKELQNQRYNKLYKRQQQNENLKRPGHKLFSKGEK